MDVRSVERWLAPNLNYEPEPASAPPAGQARPAEVLP
jgi:hypothetical protein